MMVSLEFKARILALADTYGAMGISVTTILPISPPFLKQAQFAQICNNKKKEDCDYDCNCNYDGN